MNPNLLGISTNNNIGGVSTPAYLSTSSTTAPSTTVNTPVGATIVPGVTTTSSQYNQALPVTTPQVTPTIKPSLNPTPITATPNATSIGTTTPVALPTPPVDTSNTKVAGYTAANMNQYSQEQNTNQALGAYQNIQNNQNNNTDTNLANDLATRYGIDPQALLSKLSTQGQVNADLNNQYDVSGKTQAAQDAYNNYNAASLALNQQIEQIYHTPGITQAVAQAQVQELQRAGNANLANLAVINQAAQGNMQTAMNIVQMKLDAQFKPIQNQIDALGKFVQLNNADLTDSQKTQLENQRFVMQNNLQQITAAKQSGSQTLLQNGAYTQEVANQLDNAQTPTEVNQIIQNALNGGTGNSSNGQTSGQGGVQQLSQTAQNYVDYAADGTPYVSQDRLNNMTAYQKQQVSSEYANAKIRVLQPGEVSALGTIDQASADLSLFENTANKLLSSGTLGRIQGLTTNQLAQFTQTNPEWRQFQTLRAGLIKSVQGIAAGAPGLRVTGAELANAADALPNSTDNLESAQQAVQTFRDLLNVNKNILLRNQVGSSNGGSSGTSDNPFSDSNFYGK